MLKLNRFGGLPLDSLAKSGFPSLHMRDSLEKKWFPFINMHNCLPPYLMRVFLQTNSV